MPGRRLAVGRPFGPIQRRAVNSAAGTARVSVTAGPRAFVRPSVLQLTDATIHVNGSQRGAGHCDIGQGVGGQTHAEQKAWNAAKSSVDAKFADAAAASVTVNFTVDQSICEDCQDWFENTLHPYLETKSGQNGDKPFQLNVTVDGTTISVLGVNETTWPEGVGDNPRLSLVERLKAMLIETGGLSDDYITLYNAHGESRNIEYWGNVEPTLRQYEDEIKASHELFRNFQETGMVVTGRLAEIDLDEIQEQIQGGAKH